MTYTLSIIKPDATARNITGKINSVIEAAGLRIVAQKRILLTKDQAAQFYLEHKDRPFYNDLINTMTSGPVVVQVLDSEGDTITLYRNVMGATNPANAEEGTIRKLYAVDIESNSVHGSDSPASAEREVKFFFNENEIVG